MSDDFLSITYPDDHQNSAQYFAGSPDASKLFVILPALGVRASFYKDLASKIAQKGFHAVTLDWRGQGKSSLRPGRGVDFGYAQLIDDLKVAVTQINRRFPAAQPTIIGHSLGGQLGSLLVARYPELVNEIRIVAACSVYYKGWSGLGALQVYTVAWLFPMLSRLLGYFPGDILGFGGREFPMVMKDWGYNGRTGLYRPSGDTFDYEQALTQTTATVYGYSIAGDHLAPAAAMKNLLNKFGTASMVHYQHLTPDITGAKLNHFTWAKRSEAIVDILIGQ